MFYNERVLSPRRQAKLLYVTGVSAQLALFYFAFLAIAAALLLTQQVVPFRYMGF